MAGPLSGLKVLDFSSLLPGPYATMVLADMGAEVLRVLSPGRPDLAAITPPFLPDGKTSVAIAYLGRGKRALNLNLKHPRAVEVVLRLLGTHDILLEQNRPGVMDSLGLGYEALSAHRPELIYCSLTGYGQSGAMRDAAGHDINYLARSGLMSYSGRADGGPTLMGMQIADVASGSMNAVVGILAAAVERQRTGRGRHVDVSMTDGAAAFNALVGAGFLAMGEEPGMESNLLNGGSLYDYYETADGRYISVGSLEPKFFEKLCHAVGRPDCIAGWVVPPDLDLVKGQLREIFRQKTQAQWVAVFDGLDACVEPVLNMAEAYAQPMAGDRGWVVEAQSPDGERVRQPGPALKFDTRQEPPRAGTPDGVDTADVLAELGYGADEVSEMASSGLFD